MKKIIILAYDFPPYISVGAQRPYYWFKNLIKYGVKPIVFTRYWEKDMQGEIGYVSPGRSNKCEIEELECGLIYYTQYSPNIPNRLFLRYGKEKHKILRRTLSAFIEFLQYFLLIGPKKNIYLEANEYLKKNHDVDLIIATGDPFILLHYASKLSKKHKIPWIADYRDPWSHTDKSGKTIWQQSVEKRLEERINKSANRITTVSDLLRNFIVCDNKDKISVVENGFNDAYLDINLGEQNKDVLTIAYAGSIQRFFPIGNFLAGIDTLRRDGKFINVLFYGINNEFELKSVIHENFPNLIGQITIISKMPNEELLHELSKANLLLLFNSYASYGTKIYDYFAVRRNILLCFTEDQKSMEDYYKYRRIGFDYEVSLTAQAELIERTRSGTCIRNFEHLVVVLNEMYSQHKMLGHIICNSVGIEKFSRGNQTKILSDIISEVAHSANSKAKLIYPQVNDNLPVILILAYDFPPYVSAGGLRPYSWSKYLIDYGLYPVVVTRQWENKYGNHLDYIAPSKTKETIIEESDKGIIIRTPYKANLANKIMLKYGENKYKFIRKFISAFYELFQWIFFVGSKSGLYFGAKQYLKENKVDCIIATGDPFILFKYASKLSRKFNIPWVADYRDPWSNRISINNKPIQKNIAKILEKKYLKNVKLISTVSEYLVAKIKEIVYNKPFVIIPNGYNENIITKNIKANQNKKVLTISLAGTIYNWHPYVSFLKVSSNFLRNKPNANFKINFYGINKEDSIIELIKNDENLKKIITIYPKMSNNKLAMELAKSNILLLFNDYSIMGTKIYDYLALNRKIILCFEDDEEANLLKEKHFKFKSIKGLSESLQADLIRKTNSGIVVKDSEHLYEVLNDLCNEFEEKSYIENHTIDAENYSRKKQTQKLSEIIKNIKN